jgi:nucleoside-diphosphate kinase
MKHEQELTGAATRLQRCYRAGVTRTLHRRKFIERVHARRRREEAERKLMRVEDEYCKHTWTRRDEVRRKKEEWERRMKEFNSLAGVPMERTLALILPHSVENGDVKAIKHIITAEHNFEILFEKTVQMSVPQFDAFFGIYLHRPFWHKLRVCMTRSPLHAMVLQRHDAIDGWSELMGCGNPNEARRTEPNSLRAKFGVDAYENAVYGSEGWHDAAREACVFFGEEMRENFGKPPELNLAAVQANELAAIAKAKSVGFGNARKNSVMQVARMRAKFRMKAKKAKENTDSWGSAALEAEDWEARLSKDDDDGALSESSASDDDAEDIEDKRKQRESRERAKVEAEEVQKLKELTKRIHDEEEKYEADEAYKKTHETDVDQLEREWEEQQAWFAKVERDSALHEHEKEKERMGL